MSRSNARTWPALLVAALLLALALPLLDPGVQLYDRDTGRCEYPFKHELAARLAQHQFPLWVPWTEGGTSLLAQLTPAVFHPATLLFLVFPFDLGFKLDHLLALALAAVGAWLLARKLGADAWGAAAAAAGLAGSGWMVSMAASNVHFAYGAAATPLALFGLLALDERPTPLRLLGGAFALALAILAGEPQSAVFAVLLGALLVFSRAARTSRAALTRARLARSLGLLAAWASCALLLAAPAALPAFLRLRESNRTSSTGATALFSLPPARLAGLLLPWAFDDTSEQLSPEQGRTPYQEFLARESSVPFSTSIALGAPLLLCALAPGRRRARALWLGALVCLAAALGPRLGLDPLLQFLVPPLRLFRFAEKWLAPATLLLALAGGLGLSRALGEEDSSGAADATDPYHLRPAPGAGPNDAPRDGSVARARLLWRCALALAALLGLAFVLVRLFGESLRAALVAHGSTHAPVAAALFSDALGAALGAESLLALAIAAAAALKLHGSPRLGRLSAPLAALACALSAWLCSSSLLFTAPVELLHGPFPLAEELRARDPGEAPRIDSDPDHALSLGDANWRLGLQAWTAGALATQFNGLAGVESVAVYSSLGDRDYLDAWHAAPAAMTSLFAVRFQLRSPWALSVDEARANGFAPTATGMWLRERAPEPRAFLLGCAQALERAAGLRALGRPSFDPRREAVLREEDAAALRALDCAKDSTLGTAGLARPRPEQIEATIDAARPALLVLSEHFDPGWSVSLDGRAPTPALQLDRAALGALVPAGHHALSFRFLPRGLLAGLALAAALVLALLGAALKPALRRALRARPRRPARSAP